MSDLISRKAILKHIAKIRQDVKMMDDIRRASIIMNGIYLCEKAVKNQPSAQPEEFEWCHDCKEYDQTEHCCHRWTKVIRETVEEITYAQPERKRGKWIDQDGGAFYTMECSECHKEPLLDEYGDYVQSDFCPHCGADMRTDSDEA